MATREKLQLASFDGGGVRSISQLEIMRTIMHRLRFEKHPNEPDRIMLPCEHFDMIAGSDTGGLIAIMFTKLRMSVEEAMDEFYTIYEAVYGNGSVTPEERSRALRQCSEDLLKRRGLPADLELVEETMDGKCAGFVLATPCANVSHIVRLRTYPVHTELSPNITVVEAVLATCSSQPAFAPASFGVRHDKQEYVGAALGVNNPVREVLIEAHLLFGGESSVTSLLSIGSGHVGVVSVTPNGSATTFLSLLQDIALDCEKRGREMQEQIGALGIYFRFSVEQGMQNSQAGLETDLAWMVTQTRSYVADPKVSGKLDAFMQGLDAPDRVVTLEQLKHTGGSTAVYKTSPMLATHYIRRPSPWTQLVQGVISTAPEQIIVVIAGMAGCGKTQLVADLMREYNPEQNTQYYVFFVDGSSEASIQSDLVAHIQLVRPSKGDMDMDDVKNFFQNPRNGRWLIVFDNVDDTDLPLSSFFPQCDHGAIVVTTRNQALGLLASRNLHLELDVMSGVEAVAVLLLCARMNHPSDEDKRWALAIAERLGCLPVALSQAGCYMYEAACSGGAYLALLEKHRPTLMSRPSHTRQMDCAYAALDISYQRLPLQLQNLVHLLSFFHFANFPDAIVPYAAKRHFLDEPFPIIDRDPNFEAAVQLLNEIFLSDGIWSDLTLPEMARVLRNYSIISITSTSTTNLWRIHPLMREWAFDRLPKDRRTVFRDAACRLFVCAIEADHIGNYLPPHIRSVVDRSSDSSIHMNDGVAAGKILYLMDHQQAARDIVLPIYNTLRREYGPNDLRLATVSLELAKTWFPSDCCRGDKLLVEAIRVRTEVLSADTIEVLKAQSLLSRSLVTQRKFQTAQSLLEAVLHGFKAKPGDAHLYTLGAKSSLAEIYMHEGRHTEAEALLTEVLDECRSQLGEDRRETFNSMHTLALAYTLQGRLSEAEELLLAVLGGQKTQLREYHVDNLHTMDVLAANYRAQGRLSEANALQVKVLEALTAELGDGHLMTLDAMGKLGVTCYLQGRYSEAEPLQLKVLQSRQTLHGDSHLDTITSMVNLISTYCKQRRFSDAEPLASKVLDSRRDVLGEAHPDTITAMYDLSTIHHIRGNQSQAELLGVRVVENRRDHLGEENAAMLDAMRNLAMIYSSQNRYHDAEQLEVKIMDMRKAQLGEKHLDTLSAMEDLAVTLMHLSRHSDAECIAKKLVDIRKREQGETHPETLVATRFFARTHLEQGNYSAAIALLTKLLEILTSQLGEVHVDTLEAMCDLAVTYREQGDYLKAEPLQLKVLDDCKARLGEEHEQTIQVMAGLASTYFRNGRINEAEPLYLKLLELRTVLLGATHADTLADLSNLAVVYSKQGRYSEAETLEVKLVEIQNLALGETNPNPKTLDAMNRLAYTHITLGRHLDAENLMLKVLKFRETALGEVHPDTLEAMSTLALAYSKQGRNSEAVALQAKVLEAQATHLGGSHRDTLNSMRRLASIYYQHRRYSDCEALEIKIIESHRAQLGEVHSDTLSALRSLTSTYTAQERYSEAEALQLTVLVRCKEQLGEAHVDTLNSMQILVSIYSVQNDYHNALPLQFKLLELLKAEKGEGHPDTLPFMTRLAGIYTMLGRHADAENLQIEVLKGTKEQLGEENESTLRAMTDLSMTYYKQDRYSEAEPLEVRALEICTILNGEDSLHVSQLAHSLAMTYCHLGRLEEAMELVLRSQKVLLQNEIGPEDPRYVSGVELFLALLDVPSPPPKRKWYHFKLSFKPRKWFHNTR